MRILSTGGDWTREVRLFGDNPIHAHNSRCLPRIINYGRLHLSFVDGRIFSKIYTARRATGISGIF